MRVLFINPHPDDTEFTSAATCKRAVELGWDVYEVLMTCDEYGTSREEFKGKRIRRIREFEMFKAAKKYGINKDGTLKIRIWWFGEIDGHIRFTHDVLEKLMKIIKDINPDIVFTPEFLYSMDFHPDHYKTGLLTYFAIKKIYYKTEKESQQGRRKPILFLYHSFKPNFFIKIEDFSIQIDAWAEHQSQTTPFLNKVLKKARKIYYFLRFIKTGVLFGEGFRRIYFREDENVLKGFFNKLLYYLFKFEARNPDSFNRDLYRPPPKELGLSPKSLQKGFSFMV